jgi:hypothetical protein
VAAAVRMASMSYSPNRLTRKNAAVTIAIHSGVLLVAERQAFVLLFSVAFVHPRNEQSRPKGDPACLLTLRSSSRNHSALNWKERLDQIISA